MKILIIATYFPPQNSIASLRPYSWAKYWSRLGHDVTVLTTKKKHRLDDLNLPAVGFTVLETDFRIPFSNWNQEIKVGEDNSDTPNKKHKNLKISLLKILKNIYSYFTKTTGCFSTCRFPDWHDGWAKNAVNIIKNKSWDVVVSTGGPYSVHRVGLYLKKNNKVKQWVVDWRDLWVNNHIYKGFFIFWPYEILLERNIHNYADLITTVSEPLANVLRNKTKKKVVVIHNGFDPEDLTYVPVAKIFPDDNMLRIVYTGTIYPGIRDPSPLFKAIKKIEINSLYSTEHLKVIFAGHSENASNIASKYNVSKYCEFRGSLPREDALRLQRDADVLLFLDCSSKNIDGILTGKLFEYLYNQVPIWAIGISKNSAAGKLILESNSGLVFGDDSTLIEEALIDLLKKGKDKKYKTELPESVLHYTRENQAKKLLAYFDVYKKDWEN